MLKALISFLLLLVCACSVHEFVCDHMLNGPISSDYPLMFTWSGVAVKSKGKNRKSVFIYLSAFKWRVAVFTAHTP